MLRFDLGAQAAVVGPPAHLLQARLELNRQATELLGDNLGGGSGAAERAGDDAPAGGFADQVAQQPPHGLRLAQTELRELTIHVTLDAALAVELGLAVPNQVDHRIVFAGRTTGCDVESPPSTAMVWPLT